jgi:predicted MFS family arabinose efflux permease
MLRNSLKGLPKENWQLFTVTLINRIGSMALFFLILYVHNYLKFSVEIGGFILALYGVGAILSGLLGGWLTDYWGPFRTMSLSFLISGMIMLLYPFAHNLYLLYVLTFFWGLIGESYRAANQVATQEFSSVSQRKMAFSLQRLAFNVGITLAPVIGGLLINFNYTSIFVVDAFTTLAAFVFVNIKFKKQIKSYKKSKSSHSISQKLKTAILDKKIVYPMLAFLLLLIVFFQFGSTLPIFMVNKIHVILFQLHISSYTTHWKYNTALGAGALLIAIAFGSFGFASSLWVVIAAVILLTIGEMIFFPILAAYIAEIAPPNLSGLYMGIYATTLNAALVISPIIGTQLLQHFGALILWVSCFIIGTTASSLFLLKVRA